MIERVVIVGAGHAGVQVAASLRDAGYSGGLTLVGEEPHLPYQRPPLSKDYLTPDEEASPSRCVPSASSLIGASTSRWDAERAPSTARPGA